MKDLNRLMILCVIFVWCAMLAVSSISAQAQAAQADCEPLYKTFLDNRKGPDLGKYKTALTAGNDYLAKCSGLDEEIKTYVTKQIPKISETVRTTELVNRFNAAVPTKNWDEAFSSGKELIASNHSASLDVMIVLASIGYTNAMADPPIDKFNSDSLVYAKTVIQKLNEGATSESFGSYQFAYKTKICPDGKPNTMSWMNYFIGRITYLRLNQKKEEVPYLYAAHKSGCELKNDSEIYRLIGAWYVDDAIKLNTARAAKIKAAGDQETEETKADEALLNGYLDRGIDAYARAYSSANSTNSQAYKDALHKRLEGLFDSRHDGNHDGIDKFVAGVMNNPFPDPTTPVKPVVEPPAAAQILPAAAATTPKKP